MTNPTDPTNPTTLAELEAVVSRPSLREEMNDWFIKISDDVKEIIDYAGGMFLSDKGRAVHWQYGLDCMVKQCHKYIYFYRSAKNPERLAAVSADKYYRNYLVPAINHHLRFGDKASRFAVEYLKDNTWLSWIKVSGMDTPDYAPLLSFDTSAMRNWLGKNGTLLKVGKALAYMGTDSTDHEIEVFSHFVAERLREITATSDGVQVSSTPSAVYTMPHRRASDLGNSCMRNEGAARFAIYDDIEACSIAYITEDGYLIGRALLWDNVTEHERGTTVKIMDRCYFRDRDVLSRLLAYGRENGYLVKEHPDKANCRFYLDPKSERHVFARLSVPTGFILKENSYSEIPYLDTFCFAEEGDDRLTSFDTGGAELRDTEGVGDFLTGDRRSECNECGRRVNEDDLHMGSDGNLYCDTCFSDLFLVCERCGDTFPREEETVVDGDCWCSECVDEAAARCDQCDNWVHYTNIVHSHSAGETEELCEDCFEARKDEFSTCPECLEIWTTEDMRPIMVETGQLSLFDDKPQFAPSNTLACPDCATRAMRKAA